MTLKLDNSIPKDPYTKQLCCDCDHVDIVLYLKGSDGDDVHNHLVISDLVSILRFEKSG